MNLSRSPATLRRYPLGRALAALACAILAAGCRHAPTFDVAPPSAKLQRQVGQGLWARGQGLWLENRVLSAAHVLLDEGHLPSSIWLDGRTVAVLTGRTGGYQGQSGSEHVEEVAGDWVAVAVDAVSPMNSAAIVAGDGRVRAGERLYLVGFDPAGREPGLRILPVRVFAKELDLVDDEGEERPLPPTVIAVRPLNELGPVGGWSGSFVGRYDRQAARWSYVGHLTNQLEDARSGDTDLFSVVRPPEDVVRWFFEGAGE